jgi:hypothetical protein
MNRLMKNVVLALFLVAVGLATVACPEKGPAEKAGEKIDDAVDETKDAVKDATK